MAGAGIAWVEAGVAAVSARPGRAALAVVAAALILRVGLVLALHIEPHSDYASYWAITTNLVEGRGIIDIHGNRAVTSAGYPLLLYGVFLVTGQSLLVAQLTNAALGALSVWLVYLAGGAVLGSRGAAVLAAALWAIYPPALLYTELLAKEHAMIPLLLAQVIAMARYRDARRPAAVALGFGVTLGAQAVAGPAALVVGFVFLAQIAWTGRGVAGRLRDLLALVLGTALLLGPWLYRNEQVLGAPVLNTNGGFNLYLGNNPAATGMFVSIADTPLAEVWPRMVREEGELAADRHARRLAEDYIKAHPLDTIALSVKKLGLFWAPPLHRGGGEGTAERLVRWAWAAQYLVLAGLALVSLRFWRPLRDRLWILYASTAAYAAVHMVFYVIVRYRLPIMPLVCLLAASAACALYARRGRGRTGGGAVGEHA